MARPKKPQENHICENKECNNEFTKKYPKQKFCKQSCSQSWKKTNKEWLEKRYNTNIEKYGVKSPLESEDIRNIYKENFLKNHGVESPFQSEKIREKSKLNKIQKWGTEWPMNLPEVRKKLSESRKGVVVNRDVKLNLRWEKIIEHCNNNDLIPLFEKDLLENNLISDLKNVPF